MEPGAWPCLSSALWSGLREFNVKSRRALADILFEDPNRIGVAPGEPTGGASLRSLERQGGSRLAVGLWLVFAIFVTAASVGLWTFIVTGLWKLAVHLLSLFGVG